jgi:hypothetical protein
MNTFSHPLYLKTQKLIFSGVFGFMLLFLVPLNTFAAVVVWDGSESSDWATAANWVGGAVPGQADDVIIDGNYTNAPVLDLAGGAVTIGSLILGENNESLLTISNGDTDTKKLIITIDVTIGGNGTLTHTANSTTEAHKLFLEVGGNLTIASGGQIDVNEKGYATEQGHGAGGSASKNGSGAGHGGNGGLGGTSPSFAGTPYGSLTTPIANGSGGGKSMYSGAPGGSGGGVIYLLVSGTVTNEGSILANGGNGEASLGYSGGGGSGGSIYINAHTLEGAGTIAVNGGNGGTGNNHRDGGGGGGGRIALHYDTDNSTFATLSAYGGSGPGNAQSGGAGTIVTKASTDTNGHLLVDNNNQSDGALTTTAQSETVNSITVQNQGKFHIAVSHTITNTGSISGNASIYNSGIYNHPSPTLTIPTGLTWYENGTDPHIGVTQPITDIILDGTLEFQNQNTDITPASFNSITINNGGILTHQANSTTQTDALNLDLGDLTINEGGAIDVSGKGYQGGLSSRADGAGPGAGSGDRYSGNGAGYGGDGGLGSKFSGTAGTSYGAMTMPTTIGSGGGAGDGWGSYGGSGGGAIKIVVSNTITNNGSVVASGSSGMVNSASGGGGSGGSIWMSTGTLTGTGTIVANGGSGADAFNDGGGGGGGRIALHYDTDNSTLTTLSAYGGSGPGNAQSGGAGTIVTKSSTDTNGHLLVDNNNQSDGALTTTAQSETVNSITVQNQGKFHIAVSHTITNTGSISGNASIYNSGIYNHPSPTLTIPTGLTWYENGTDPHIGDTQPITDIIIDGTLEFQNQNTDITPTSFNSITINNGGILTHQANTNTQTDALNLDLDDLTINQGGKIDVSGKGYDVSQGPGKGIDNSSVSSGAGHGGDGGNSSSGVAGGAAYGSVNEPITIGSGGGISSSSARTGRGGGAIKLIITNAIAIEGIIDASGLNGSGGRSDGGGAGGSVWITTASISGSGSIIANGGNGSHSVYGDGGGGGGGRIALHYDTDNSTLTTLSAYGGSGPGNAQSGGAGTIVTKSSTDTNGHLLVDNNNQSDGALTTTAQSETVNSITVQNQGKFHIAVSHTITNTGSISGNASIYNSGIYNHPSPTLTIPTGLTWYENGTDPHIGDTQPITDIIIDGTLEFQNQNTDITPTSFNSITINNGGILTHQANTNTQTDALNLDLDDLTINQGGKIDVSGKGYDVSQGPGKGIDNSSVSSGAGHGGDGGNSSSGVAGGAAYGSVNEPITIGSGGGISSSSARTGRGGGAIKLIITNAIAIEGIIDASGLNGSGGRSDGGGAGGSVWITTASISGSGSIIANGGNGSHSVYGDGGGGGGGRIALHYDTDNSTLTTLSAYGGSGPGNAQSGGAGTIVTKASTDTNGHLLVDNNNQSDGALTTTAQSETVNSITVQNQGKFHIAVSHTITNTGSISGNASIYNSGIYNHPSPTLTIPTGLTWYENGTDPHIGDTQPITDIIIDGTLEFQNQNTDITPTSFNSITINNGGILTHQANTNTQTDALNLDLDDLTINQGGKIDVSGKGYDVSQGPGKGIDNSSVSSGAGHGGDGGNSSSGVAGGAAYGSVNEPITIGSGGEISSSSARTGRGGGAIKLIITNAIAIEGIIDASGLNGSGGRSDGGGAGGSVWITAASISGSGSIIANGGNGSHSVYGGGGGGGGGRIALCSSILDFPTENFFYTGGVGPGSAQNGEDGTLCFQGAHVIALGTVTNPETCSGASGSIEITGLMPLTQYDVEYLADGASINSSMTSNQAGIITLADLSAGIYSDIQVPVGACSGNTIPSVTLVDEQSIPGIFVDSFTDPTSCDRNDGKIDLSFTNVPNGAHSITYDGGSFLGVEIINNLAVVESVKGGTYENLKVSVGTCTSSEDPDVTLTTPMPEITILEEIDPEVCGGIGEIVLQVSNPPNNQVELYYTGGTFSGRYYFNHDTPISIPATERTYNNINIDYSTVSVNCTSINNPNASLSDPDLPEIEVLSTTDPPTCLEDGLIELAFNNVANGNYAIGYNGGSFEDVEVVDNAANIPALAGQYEDLNIIVAQCTSVDDPDVELKSPEMPSIIVSSISYPPNCAGDGAINFQFSNVPDGVYTISYDGGSFDNVSISDNAASVFAPVGNYIDLSITVDGCTSIDNPDAIVTFINIPTLYIVNIVDPATCGGDGTIELSFTNTPNGTYEIFYDGGSFTDVNVENNATEITALQGIYNNIYLTVGGCNSIDFPDAVVSDPEKPTLELLSHTNQTECNGKGRLELHITGLSSGQLFTIYHDDGEFPVFRFYEDNGTFNPSVDPGEYNNLYFVRNNCVSEEYPSVTIEEFPIPEITLSDFQQPASCAETGTITIATTNVENGLYDFYYDFGLFTNVSVEAGVATINAPIGIYNNIRLEISNCITNEDIDVIIAAPETPTIGIAQINQPANCIDGGSIDFVFTNVEDGSYTIDYEGGAFSGVEVTGNTASVSAEAGIYDSLGITVGTCASVDYPSVVLADPPAPNAYISYGSPQLPLLWQKKPLHTIGTTSDVSAEDFNGDGHLDMLAIVDNNKIAWYENNGLQTFTEHFIVSNANNIRAVFPEDINNDGKMDFMAAISHIDNKIVWYRNDGTGSFTEIIVTENDDISGNYYDIFVKDMDSDGDKDVIVSDLYDLFWYENMGEGAFAGDKKTIGTDIYSIKSIFAADMDADGKMDVLSASEGGELALHHNLGFDIFEEIQIPAELSFKYAVLAEDIDQDGDLDILSGGTNLSTFAWHENTAPLTYTLHSLSSSNERNNQVFAADMDNDGDIDLLNVFSYEGGSIYWHENDGSQNFTEHEIDSQFVRSISAVDMDQDGDQDILAGASGSWNWYDNQYLKPICMETSVSLEETGGDAVSWSWSTEGSGLFNNEFISNPSISNASNLDLVSVSIEDNKGCTSTHSIKLPITGIPTISVSVEPACGALEFSFTNVPDGRYNIDYDGGSFTDVEIIGNKASIAAEPGSYVDLSISVYNCTSAEYPSVTVTQTPPGIRVIGTTLPEYCNGEGIIHLAFVNVSDGTYDISYDGGEFLNVLINANAADIPAQAGTYNNLYISSGGCTSSEYPDVVLLDAPPLMVNWIIVTDPETCGGNGTIQFDVSYTLPSSGEYFLDVFYDGGVFENVQFDQYIGRIRPPAGVYDNIVLDFNGCRTTEYLSAVISDPPTATISLGQVGNPTFCEGSDGSISIEGLENGLEYDVSYTKDGSPVNVSLWSDVEGKINIGGLADGVYDQIKTSIFECESNALGPIELSNPTSPSIAIVKVTDAPSCDQQGQIDFSFANVNDGFYTIYYDGGAFLNVEVVSDLASVNVPIGIYANLRISIDECTSLEYPTATVHSPDGPRISIDGIDQPVDCDSDGRINLSFSNVPDNFYDIVHNGGVFADRQVALGFAEIITPAGSFEDLRITVGNCTSIENPDAYLTSPDAPTISISSVINPIDCGENGIISLSFTNVPDAIYTISYDGGEFNSVVISGNSASINTIPGVYNNLRITVNECTSSEDPDVILVNDYAPTIQVISIEDPASCGADGKINLSFTNVEDGFYTINYTAGSFEGVLINSGIATISASVGIYEDLSISIGGCTSVNNPDVILSDPIPDNSYALTNPTICVGEAAVIQMSGSENGVSYQLRLESDNTDVGPAIEGTGNAIEFIVSPVATTVYNVLATAVTEGCSIELSELSTVTVNDLPSIVCGADQSHTTDAGVCNAVVTVTSPTYTTACGFGSLVNNFTNTDDASGTFPVGETTVTWTVTDLSGNTATCEQKITVNDNEDPTASNPDPLSVQCNDDIPDPDISVVTDAADNCTANPMVAHVSDVSDGNSCPETITRTYSVTDDCGNSINVTQTVTVDDDTDPTASNPDPLSVQCNDDIPDPDISVVTDAADNCTANPVVAHVSDVSDGNSCPEVITRTYSVTDDCGNSINVVQTISIDDDTDPTADPLPVIDVQCAADVPAVDINDVQNAADNCTANPVVAHVSDISDGNNCPEVITRTYSVTDDCGNSINVVQTISIDDDTDPTADPLPVIDVQCAADIPAVDITDVQNAADNCTANPVVVHVSDVSDGNNCPEVITRTYSVTDDCGNSIEVVQTITINDDTDPTADPLPAIDVQCAADLPAVDINDVQNAADNCTANPVVAHVSDVSDGNTCPEVITRTYSVTDDCGNSINVVQTITIDDDTDPTASNPAPINVQCASDVPAPDVSVVTDEADNCSTDPVVAHVSDVSDGNSCPETITRTYSVTDDCGNSINVVQTITINDDTDPTASNPAPINVQCASDVPAPDVSVVTDEADNCSSDPVVAHVSDVSDGNSCPEVITRTYSVTDDCGNSINVVQTITIDDDTDPTASNPAPINVQCASDVPAPDVSVVTDQADNCSPDPVVAHVSDVSDGNSCPKVITRTYSVTDDCGNSINVVQTITIDDDTDPTASNPAPINVQCASDVPAPDVSVVTDEADNCSTDPVVVHVSDVSDGNTCPEVITRTYSVTDDCGNSINVSQTITIDDDTDPVAICKDITVPLDGTGNVSIVAADIDFNSSDNCGIVSRSIDISDFDCDDLGPNLVELTVTDACGNSSTCTSTVTVEDNISPVLTCPSDRNEDVDLFDNFTIPDYTGLATVSDNCTASPLLSQLPVAGTVVNGVGTIHTITITATDSEGNSSQCSFDITLVDPFTLSITCPGDQTEDLDLNCDFVLPDYTSLASSTGAVSVDQLPAIGTIVSGHGTVVEITLIALDGGGATEQCTFDVNLEDNIAPTASNPAPINVQCASDVPAPDVSVVTDEADNCSTDPVVAHVSDVSDGNSCPETITRTYSVTDDCGNSINVVQTISIDDDTDPTADPLPAIDVQCAADVPAVDINDVQNAADNCTANPVVAHVSDVSDGNTCPEVITRTYSVTDDCGNSINVVQTITIDDDTDPTADPLPAIDVQCAADVPAVDINDVQNAADNCTANPVVAHVSDVSDGNTCPEVITRTYSVTDDCGNSINVSQTITIDDDTDPTASNPAPINVQCASDVPAPDVSVVTDEADNCSTDPVVAHVSDVSDGNSCPETITRTYSVTDDCGNSINVVQTITIDDDTDPTASNPAPINVQCASDVPAPDVSVVTDQADNCSTDPVVAHVNDVSDGNSCPEVITRTYSVTDDCGNSINVVQTITIDDDTDPTASNPAPINVQCASDVPAPDVSVVTDQADNCSTDPVVAHVSDVSDGNSCPEVITRTYSVTDDCGNSINVVQTITIDDDTDPTADPLPAIDVQCAADLPAVDINDVQNAADNCTANPVVAHVSDVSDGNTCPEVITRTYSVTDDCGNSINVVQTITIDDDTDPTADPLPAIDVQCAADVPAVDINDVQNAADNCTANPVVAHVSDISDGNSCPEVITRTYSVTDDCGNSINVVQTITIDDDTDPTASNPAPINVQCASDVPAPDVSVVTDEADNCSTDPVVAHVSDVSDGNSCPEVITRTYSVTDDCGNSINVSQTITIDDDTDPTASNPAPINVQCASDVPAPDVSVVTDEADNCTSDPVVAHVSDVSDGNSCPETITRTYSVTDDCGNSINVVQTITINDDTDPTASNPAPINVQCASDVPAPDVSVVTDEADNCSTDPVVAHVSDVSDGNSCPEVITRTYSVTDDCGNSIEVVQTLTINDDTAPTADPLAPIAVQCAADVPPADINDLQNVVDNCSTDPVVVHIGDESDGNSCPETITRTYSVTDDCGNSINVVQTITIDDDTDPTASNPAPINVQCASDVPAPDVSVVTDEADNCSTDPVVAHVSDVSDGNSCPETITRTYSVTDDCGNSINVVQTITIDDDTDPTADPLPAIDVQCAADVPAVDINDVQNVADNCTANPVVVHVSDVSDGNNCPEVITRTYSVTDDCGNSIEVVQTITINDDTDPTADPLPAIDVQCAADLPAVDINDVQNAADNCTANPVVAHVSDVSDGNTCPEVITRTYSVTDDCGNSINVVQTITIDDDTDPTADPLPAIDVQCAADVPAVDINDVQNAADNCTANPVVAHVSDVSDGNSCPETITRTYSVTDDCGNSIECGSNHNH